MKRKRTLLILLVIAASLLTNLAAVDRNPAAPAPDAAYLQSFEKWKAELVDDLKQNWLPLAGLFWLKPGQNSFGTDSDNAIVFPKGPAHTGVFELQGQDVTVKFFPGSTATVGGQPVTTAKLQPDTSGNPTIVELGGLRIKAIVRGQRVGIRLADVDSDEVKNYRGPVFFPLDLSYRVTATWVPSDGKKSVDVPNVLGDTTPTPVAGTVVFKINGQEVRLTDLGGDPSKGLSFDFQ